MKKLLIAALTACVALPLVAQEVLDVDSFEAEVTGSTVYFLIDNDVHGAEQYLPGRRVLWTFFNGECLAGSYFERDGQICFAYDDTPLDLQCWIFTKGDSGISALFDGEPGKTLLTEQSRSTTPLICPGPGVGV